jgi:2-amino-4-hydroxy-6-hydroxymethyldihydropteridine diphosphokinase
MGGNLPSRAGPPEATIRAAIDRIRAGLTGPERLRAQSRMYRTPCFPAGAGPDFVNAVIDLDLTGRAQSVLDRLHALEAEFGRQRERRWAGRTLDLDLLDFGGAVLPDVSAFSFWRDLAENRQQTEAPDALIAPHPRLQDRAFVLVPLHDVAPDWRHPVSGLDAAGMLARLDPAEIAQIRPL